MDPNPPAGSPNRPSTALALKAILLVDDDQQLASALQWILADENFLVDVAFDGEEALLKVKAHEYDAIICDLMMPDGGARTWLSHCAEVDPRLAERTLLITGGPTTTSARDLLEQHRGRVLYKPFELDDLRSMVLRVASAR